MSLKLLSTYTVQAFLCCADSPHWFAIFFKITAETGYPVLWSVSLGYNFRGNKKRYSALTWIEKGLNPRKAIYATCIHVLAASFTCMNAFCCTFFSAFQSSNKLLKQCRDWSTQKEG